MSPYTLPPGNVQICFSGGRTSAYLLWEIMAANGDLPDRARVVFTNTGREMPETLAFIAECGQRWGVHIDWVEYRADAPFFEMVGHNSASVHGEPFDAMLDKKQYLPNQQSRFCTIELKIRTAKRFLRSVGWERWTATVGIRADEQHRLNKPAPKERWVNWHPLATAGVTKATVSAFWQKQPFDLRLPNVKGKCWLGNCDGCFLKSEASLSSLARDFPDRHAWWEAAEERIGQKELAKGRPKDNAQFSRRHSRAEIRQFVETQGDWIFNDEAYLCQVDGGECIA